MGERVLLGRLAGAATSDSTRVTAPYREGSKVSAARFITPTFSAEFDLFAALVIEEVLSSEVHGTMEALIVLDAEEGCVNIYVTGQTPWTFVYDRPRPSLGEIQQTSLYRDAVERCRGHFRELGVIEFVAVPSE